MQPPLARKPDSLFLLWQDSRFSPGPRECRDCGGQTRRPPHQETAGYQGSHRVHSCCTARGDLFNPPALVVAAAFYVTPKTKCAIRFRSFWRMTPCAPSLVHWLCFCVCSLSPHGRKTPPNLKPKALPHSSFRRTKATQSSPPPSISARPPNSTNPSRTTKKPPR